MLLFVVIPVQHAALIDGVAEVYLDLPLSVGQAYRPTLRLVPAIVGTYLLVALILFFGGVVLSGVVGGIVGGITAAKPTPALAIIALLPTGALAVYLLARWSLIGPVMIIERRFGWSSLRRSRELVKGA